MLRDIEQNVHDRHVYFERTDCIDPFTKKTTFVQKKKPSVFYLQQLTLSSLVLIEKSLLLHRFASLFLYHTHIKGTSLGSRALHVTIDKRIQRNRAKSLLQTG